MKGAETRSKRWARQPNPSFPNIPRQCISGAKRLVTNTCDPATSPVFHGSRGGLPHESGLP